MISNICLPKICCFPLLLLIIFSCSRPDDYPQPQKWQLVYQNDFNGQPVSGSIENLVTAMKKGSPIRVSWGGTEDDGSSWIEFAEPVFTTVMNDTAVVAQFPLSFIKHTILIPARLFYKRIRSQVGGPSWQLPGVTISFIMIWKAEELQERCTLVRI